MAHCREFLAEAVAGAPEGRLPAWWLALSSPTTGTGKSWLAFALAADLCRAGVPVLVVSEVEMMAQLRDAQRPGSEFGIINLRHRWLKAPVLVLDDVGSDKPTEFSAREFYGLVEQRRRARRPMVLTTNRTASGLERYFERAAGAEDGDTDEATQAQRIGSRLIGMTRGGRTWVEMDGPDLRAEGEV